MTPLQLLTTKRLAQIAWVAAIALNVYWLIGCDGAFVPHECRMLHWLVVALLCFPISVPVMLLAFATEWAFSLQGNPLPATTLYWGYLALMVGLGYLQWFWWLPRLASRLRGYLRRQADGAAGHKSGS